VENLSPRINQFRAGAAALAASFLLAPALMAAQGSAGQATGEKVAPSKKAAASRKLPAGRAAPAAKHASTASKSKSPTRTTSTTKGTPSKKRRLSPRQQRARLHLQPDRTQEIQRALIQAGYLHQEATGTWDELTREAMRRYQTDHGFPVTGLPDAKSLMKLGLGPHPLPPELDASVKAQANAAPQTKADPTSDPPSHPTEAASPPKK
jgi:peptidoglycan hydrolase-like protein with peptidoglycan-binding domain